MSEQIELIEIEKIKPDPNQPRDFDEASEKDLKELNELAGTYATQGMIHAIEVDENGLIILGERRWRAAKKVGLKQVKIVRKTGLTQQEKYVRQSIDDTARKALSSMERAWLYGTMIVNINTGKNYTIEEVKEMEQKVVLSLIQLGKKRGPDSKSTGTAQLSKDIQVPQITIWNHIQCLYLEDDTQEMIGKGLYLTHAREITKLYPDYPDAKSRIEEMLRNGEFLTVDELHDYITDFLKTAAEAVEVEVEEIKETVEKETKRKAIVVKEEMKKLPVEPKKEEVKKIAEKKVKTEKSTLEKARSSLEAVKKKVQKAEKLGIDARDFETRRSEIETQLGSDPKDAREKAKRLKSDLDEATKPAETKKKEKHLEKKIEKKVREEFEEEKKEILAKERKRMEMEQISVSYGSVVARITDAKLRKKLEKVVSKDAEVPQEERKFRRVFPTLTDLIEVVDFIESPAVVDPSGEVGKDGQPKMVSVELTMKEKEKLVEGKKLLDVLKGEKQSQLLEDILVEDMTRRTTPEEIEEMRQRWREADEETERAMRDPKLIKRGKLFSNWLAHRRMVSVLGSAFCPNCNPNFEKDRHGDLKWTCCGTPVFEATEIMFDLLDREGGDKK